MLKGKYILLYSSIVFASCTNTVIEDGMQVKYVQSVSLNSDSYSENLEEMEETEEYATRGIVWYKPDNPSNTSFGTGSKYKNYFEHWDTVGIFPTVGDQIPFPLTAIPLGTEASSYGFTAQGWDLRTDVKYYAYWPFSRKNYADGNNKEHIYVKYYGQVISKNTGETTEGPLKVNTDDIDSVHSQYSYMYSAPTEAAPGSSDLAFSMKYLGGILRLKGYCTNMPSNIIADTLRVIYFQIVAPDDRFILEGTYDLETVSETGTVTITPSFRGKSNVITFKLDDVHATKTIASSGAIRAQFFTMCLLHPVMMTGCTFVAYDQNYNCYKYTYNSSNKKITSGNTLYLSGASLKYAYTATPDSIKFQPWGDEEETINSNWNYK